VSQSGLEIILGYLSPIRPLLSQDDVDEVQINEGGRRVFTKRRGVQRLESVELDPDGLYGAIKRIARAAGQEVLEEEHKPLSPDFNCRFPTGERVAVMFSPHSVGGDTVTIRRFG
jgi:Flp pilus assembly CpaF family ATPase